MYRFLLIACMATFAFVAAVRPAPASGPTPLPEQVPVIVFHSGMEERLDGGAPFDSFSAVTTLQGEGATILRTYEHFTLLNTSSRESMSGLPPGMAEERPDFRRIRLQRRTLDTGAGMTTASLSERPDRRLRVVQFAGPPSPDDLTTLELAGFMLVAPVPTNAFLVWSRFASIEHHASLPTFVHFEAPYREEDGLFPGLPLDSASDDLVRLDLWMFHDGEAFYQDLAELATFGFPLVPQGVDGKLWRPVFIGLLVPAKDIPRLIELRTLLAAYPVGKTEFTGERQAVHMATHQNSSFAVNQSGEITSFINAPSPGYIEWLTHPGRDFSQSPTSYPIVAVVDSGLADGIAGNPGREDFHEEGSAALPSRIVFSNWLPAIPNHYGNPPSYGHPTDRLGHGTLCASVVGGYHDNGSDPWASDSDGFHYGVGVNPFGRLGSLRISDHADRLVFDESHFQIGHASLFEQISTEVYDEGARIASNSYGTWAFNDSGLQINETSWDTPSARQLDLLTRDARNEWPASSQEMLFVFAAGNQGEFDDVLLDGTGSQHGNLQLLCEATAKNVLSVGASENPNPAVTDIRNEFGGHCFPPVRSNDASDLARFSSRGPTFDGRVKPDIVAPGTTIQGVFSTCNGFYSSNPGLSAWFCFGDREECAVNAPDDNRAYLDYPNPPFGQGEGAYSYSDGTSFATPAIAGYCSLIWEFVLRRYSRPEGLPVYFPLGSDPSPALLKAYVVHSGSWRSGDFSETAPTGFASHFPSVPFDRRNTQGYGMPDMDLGFSTRAARMIRNQDHVFTGSGQVKTFYGNVDDPAEPIRIALAWTDPPGMAGIAPALVNDLDLEVWIDGDVYYGNDFATSGDLLSLANGSRDHANNVECVFLPPATTSGHMVIKVRAVTVAGNCFDPEASPVVPKQDFALVAYNFFEHPCTASPQDMSATRPPIERPDAPFAPCSVQAYGPLTFSGGFVRCVGMGSEGSGGRPGSGGGGYQPIEVQSKYFRLVLPALPPTETEDVTIVVKGIPTTTSFEQCGSVPRVEWSATCPGGSSGWTAGTAQSACYVELTGIVQEDVEKAIYLRGNGAAGLTIPQDGLLIYWYPTEDECPWEPPCPPEEP